MDPFTKVFLTEAERRAYIEHEIAEFEKIDPVMKLALGGSDGYRQSLEARCAVKVEPPKIQPLTPAEAAEFRHKTDTDAMLTTMRFTPPGQEYADLPPAIAKFARERDELEQAQFLEPAKRQKSWLQQMIDDAVEKVLGKQAAPRRDAGVRVARAGDRQWLELVATRAAEAAADDPDDEAAQILSKFVNGYVNGDDVAMRSAVRQMVA